VGMRGKWWAPEANGGHRRRPADASAGRQRQVVGGGVKWQVALLGTGGKRWAFKPKAICGLRTQIAAEASGGCQSRPKKGKQSTGGGCDGGRRRWWHI